MNRGGGLIVGLHFRCWSILKKGYKLHPSSGGQEATKPGLNESYLFLFIKSRLLVGGRSLLDSPKAPIYHTIAFILFVSLNLALSFSHLF